LVQPPQAAEAEYREALVGAMEVVTQKPWPPIRQEVLDMAPLFEDATRSSLDHKCHRAKGLLPASSNPETREASGAPSQKETAF
jgi:hypothetical protein